MARRARKVALFRRGPHRHCSPSQHLGPVHTRATVAQHIKAADLCTRMNISQATLRRVEQGDPGASASTYLTALWVLGMFEAAAPGLDAKYWQAIDPLARRAASTANTSSRLRTRCISAGTPRGSPRAPRRLVEPHRTHVSRRYRRNDAAGIGLPAPYSNAGIDSVFSRSGVAISAPLDITPCLPSNAARSDSGQYSPTSRSLGNEVISAVLNPTLSTEMICAASRRYPPESDWRP